MPPAAATAAARAKREAPTERSPSQRRGIPAPSSRLPARPAVRPSAKARAAVAAFETTLEPPSREHRAAQPRSAPTRTPREAPPRKPLPPRRPSHEPQRLRVTRDHLAPRGHSALLRALVPKQSWLDRIVRGRAWIPVLGITLVAIVGLRVEVLKLTSGVGTQIQQASELQSSNATLRSSVSALSDNQRIEKLAKSMGMVMPGPMDVHFVHVAAGTHVAAAIAAIHTPESDAFLTSVADERKADGTNAAAAATTSAVGALAATVTPSTTSDSTASTAVTTGDTTGTASGTDSSTVPSRATSADTTAAGGDSAVGSDTTSDTGTASSQTGDTTYANPPQTTYSGTTDATDTPASSDSSATPTTSDSSTGGSSLAG